MRRVFQAVALSWHEQTGAQRLVICGFALVLIALAVSDWVGV